MEMNFDKNIFAQGQTLFTQDEFNKALSEAKAEIMAIAIETTKQALAIEREECAKLADNCLNIETLGDEIRNRMRPKND
jgi:Na+/phosphate symporter